MFVSVVLDPSSMDTARSLAYILAHFGFKKVQRACWEHTAVTQTLFDRLKKEIDRVTDYYDTVRMYQFPFENSFVITELSKKRWRRCKLCQPST